MISPDEAPLAAPPQGVRTTRRRGRTSAAKESALAELAPRWALAPGELSAAPRRRLDIGVGSGEATRAWAAEDPGALVVAVELHRPGLAKLLSDLDADGPANVRVLEADALEVLEAVEPGTLDAVRLLFPDPWPKRRHVGRRMVDRSFAGSVADALAPGGRLILATDWEDYAEHMRTMVATEPRLVAVAGYERPDRPVTTYEARGRRAGRTVTDLAYQRSADA